MKRLILYSLAAFALVLPKAAVAQIQNGDFETQINPPQGQSNILPIDGSLNEHNDLAVWRSYTATRYHTPDYLATNAANTDVNPRTQLGLPFSPNSGGGCVDLIRESGSHYTDQFITQQVTVIPGHTYRTGFAAIRRPVTGFAEKITVFVTNAAPSATVIGNGGSGNYQISPSPYASVVSSPISNYQAWTNVSGTFVAQGTGTSAQAWISVGYDNSLATYDSGLYNAGSPNQQGTHVDIDDVFLTDMGPACPTLSVEFQDNTVPNTNDGDLTALAYGGDGNYTYDWYIDRLDGYGYQPYGRYTVIPTEISYPIDTYTFVKCVVTSCGQSAENYWTFTHYDDGSGYRSASSSPSQAYPNPANESLTVPTDAQGTALHNSKGEPVNTSFKAGKLDVQNLPDGLYNLRFKQNGKMVNQRIQVKH